MRADGVSSLTFRLAESLTVRGVYSPEFGRLLHLRVVGQNSLIVNLPARARARHRALARRGRTAGRLPPQALDREAIDLGQRRSRRRASTSRSSRASSTATAATGIRNRPSPTTRPPSMRITVPNEFEVVATGEPAGPPAPPPGVVDPAQAAQDVRLRRSDAGALPRGASSAGSTRSTRARITGERDRASRCYVQAARAQVVPRPRHERARSAARLPVLRLARRRRAVSELHARDHRKRSARRPQPAVLRGAEPGRHRRRRSSGGTIRSASRTTRRSSSRTRSRTSGGARRSAGRTITSSGSARGSRSTSPRSTRRRIARATCCANLLRQMRHTAIDASPQGPIYLGYRLGHIQGGRPRLPRDRLQQGRDGAAHAAAAGRRRGVLRGRAELLRATGSSRRRAPTTSAAPWSRPAAAIWSGSSRPGSSAARFPRLKFSLPRRRAPRRSCASSSAATRSTCPSPSTIDLRIGRHRGHRHRR